MPKRKQSSLSSQDHSVRLSPAAYQATIAKYRKLKAESDARADVNDIPIDNAKAQEELLHLMEETKPYRDRANSLMGI